MRKHNLNVPVQVPALIRANVRVCYCQLSNVRRNLVFLPQSLRGKHPKSYDLERSFEFPALLLLDQILCGSFNWYGLHGRVPPLTS